jgi:hypothetical protein
MDDGAGGKLGRFITEWPGKNAHCFIDYENVVKRLKKVPQVRE